MVSILISIVVRLLSNEVFLKKFTLIVLRKLVLVTTEKGMKVITAILHQIIEWLEDDPSGVFKTLAAHMQDDTIKADLKETVKGMKL